MQLTNFSDYTLRMLMYAALPRDRLFTIEEMATLFDISRSHLTKVASGLTRAGYLTAVRGRAGGLKLAMDPDQIRLGDVLRESEPDYVLVECFGTDNHCIISPHCRLRGILGEALDAFTATLDRYTLNDLLLRPEHFGLPKQLRKRIPISIGN
ncbi:MAG: Rrf2 family transcriptional regulator [Lysobacteraceae bacterium]